MQEEPLVSPSAVIRELGIPRTTFYRLVNDGKIPKHTVRQPWHSRDRLAFKLSEVRAALGLPPAAPPGPGAD